MVRIFRDSSATRFSATSCNSIWPTRNSAGLCADGSAMKMADRSAIRPTKARVTSFRLRRATSFRTKRSGHASGAKRHAAQLEGVIDAAKRCRNLSARARTSSHKPEFRWRICTTATDEINTRMSPNTQRRKISGARAQKQNNCNRFSVLCDSGCGRESRSPGLRGGKPYVGL